MFNLLAASSGIGSAAVRGAGNEEAGIGKLRISEMLPPSPGKRDVDVSEIFRSYAEET